MNRKCKKFLTAALAGTMILSSGSVTAFADDTVELRMIFWDSNQEPGLVAMAEGFMAKNENVKISVETVPWDEYWTKLQAAAMGGDMPDVVVMHPDQVKNYAEGGILMDLTDVLDGEVANRSNFPEYVVKDFNVNGADYGIPKDIGTLAMYYNKDLFDAAGVEYPTNEWTWDDMAAASAKLTNKETGTYGFDAYNDGQNIYWNFIWQNGGLVKDREKNLCTMDSPEAVEAMNFILGFVERGESPTAADFANLQPDEYFESGKTAMHFGGSWLLPEFLKIDGLNFDVVELPMGKERAAICSGMAFAVSANTKHPEEAKAFAEYLGSEEAQTIQAESGIAIPAYSGTQQPWVDLFTTVDATPFVKVEEYGHTSPGLTNGASEASLILDQYMPQIFALELPVEEGLKAMTEEINALLQQ